MSQNNDDFNISMMERIFGTPHFTEQYLKGVAAKENQISFNPGEVPYPDHALRVLPKVQEHERGGGFYVIKGYEAMRLENGKEPVSQFFSVYKSAGFTLDQADTLLSKRALRHISSYEGKKPVYAYSQIDFKGKKTKNDNFKILTVPDDQSLIKTLGLIGIVGKQPEKEMIVEKLQQAQQVPVTIRVGDDYEQFYVAAAARKTGLGIDLLDKEGKLLKIFPQQVFLNMHSVKEESRERQVPTGVVNMVTADEKDKKPAKANKMH